jgi:hypothetical protein
LASFRYWKRNADAKTAKNAKIAKKIHLRFFFSALFAFSAIFASNPSKKCRWVRFAYFDSLDPDIPCQTVPFRDALVALKATARAPGNWLCFSEFTRRVFGFERAHRRGEKTRLPYMGARCAFVREIFSKTLLASGQAGKKFYFGENRDALWRA